MAKHDNDKQQIKHPLSSTALEARCPDCSASLAIPVIVSGLGRNDDGDRVLTLTVQDAVFEPYIRRHLALSDHPHLAEQVGDDWRVDDAGDAIESKDDKAE